MMSLRKRLAALSEEKRLNMLENFPSYLAELGQTEHLKEILLTFDFLHAKLEVTDPNALISDISYLSGDPDLNLVRSAIRMSAHVLVNDRTQLAGQLLGRLLSLASSEPSLTDSSVSTLTSLLNAARHPDLPAILPQLPCLDFAGGPLLRTFNNGGPVYALALTLDDRLIISDSGETLKIWNIDTGEIVRTIPIGSVNSIVLTPDGKRIVVAGSTTVKVLDFKNGKVIRTLSGHTSFVRTVAVTPNGKYICSGSDDHTIKVWDLTNGQEIRTLQGHTEAVNVVVVTPDGQMLISGGGKLSGTDFTVRIWQIESGEQVRVFSGHTREVVALAVTPDARIIISGDLDANLKVRDIQTGQLLHTLQHGDGWVQALAVTPDGKYIISASGGGILKIWDIISGECLYTFDSQGITVNCLAVTHDGKRVVSGTFGGTIKISKLETEPDRKAKSTSGFEPVTVAITLDETIAITGEANGSVKVWEIATGTERYTFAGHTKQIKGILITPDGSQAISASNDALLIWDIQSGKKRYSLGEMNCSKIMLAAKGKYFVSIGARVNIWDIKLGRMVRTLLSIHEPVAAASKSPIVIGCVDPNLLKVWDIEAEKELYTLAGHKDVITKIAISSDGKCAVSASGSILNVWNTETGKVLKTLEHEAMITALAITPDGDRMIVGMSGGILQVWDLGSFTHWRAVLPIDGWSDTATDTLRQFSDTDYMLTAVSGGNTFTVWNIQTGERLARFTADREFFYDSVAVGKSVIVTGDVFGRMYFLRLHVPDHII